MKRVEISRSIAERSLDISSVKDLYSSICTSSGDDISEITLSGLRNYITNENVEKSERLDSMKLLATIFGFKRLETADLMDFGAIVGALCGEESAFADVNVRHAQKEKMINLWSDGKLTETVFFQHFQIKAESETV